MRLVFSPRQQPISKILSRAGEGVTPSHLLPFSRACLGIRFGTRPPMYFLARISTPSRSVFSSYATALLNILLSKPNLILLQKSIYLFSKRVKQFVVYRMVHGVHGFMQQRTFLYFNGHVRIYYDSLILVIYQSTVIYI